MSGKRWRRKAKDELLYTVIVDSVHLRGARCCWLAKITFRKQRCDLIECVISSSLALYAKLPSGECSL